MKHFTRVLWLATLNIPLLVAAAGLQTASVSAVPAAPAATTQAAGCDPAGGTEQQLLLPSWGDQAGWADPNQYEDILTADLDGERCTAADAVDHTTRGGRLERRAAEQEARRWLETEDVAPSDHSIETLLDVGNGPTGADRVGTCQRIEPDDLHHEHSRARTGPHQLVDFLHDTVAPGQPTELLIRHLALVAVIEGLLIRHGCDGSPDHCAPAPDLTGQNSRSTRRARSAFAVAEDADERHHLAVVATQVVREREPTAVS